MCAKWYVNRYILLVWLAFGLAGCTALSGGTPTPLPTLALDGGSQPPSGTAASPQTLDGVTASGRIVPGREAHLVFTLGGRIESANVAVGDQVQPGQVLIQLEGQESLQAAISAAQFEMEQAQQALDALSKDLDVRQAQAFKEIADYQDAVRDAERVLANLHTDALQVDVDAAYANMILAKDRLDRARDDYKPYENKREDNPVRAALLSKLAAAQKAYDATVRTYNNLGGVANPIDLIQAEANLAMVQAQLAKAQRDYEMLKSGPDPDQVRLAQARLANAQTQLEAAQAALEQLTLAAPFAGTVVSLDLTQGEWVVPGQPVLLLVDLENIHVETTDLSERDVPGIEIGQAVTVFIEALGQEVPGRVSEVSPLADTLGGDVVYKTTIELDAIPDGLRAGMSVEVGF